jgi:RHS repeat-associated protein
VEYKFEYSNQIGKAYFYGAFVYADNYGDIYAYDNDGILTKTSNGYDYTEDYVISNNIVSSITRTIGGETKTIAENTYDANHNITEIENDEGADITYSYGSNGQMLSKIFTTGLGTTSTETYTYIQNGNYVKTHTDADGITTTYTYDSSDQAVKGLLMSVTKSNGESMSFTYDPYTDELISVNVSGGGNQNTDVEITYTDGKISNINHNSTDYSFSYLTNSDVFNKAYIGSQLLFTNYAYKNRIESRYYDSLNLTNYFPRDLEGKPKGENWGPDDSKCGFIYDKSDRVCLITDLIMYPFKRNYYYTDYALYDQPSHVIGSDNTQSLYEYDMAGNVSRFTFLKDNDTIYEGRYRLNEKALPESVFVSGALTANMQYQYDDFYRVTSNSCGPIINSYSYPQGSNVNNADMKPVQYSITNFAGSPYHQYTLQYDNRQNIASVTDGNITSAFAYNSLDQLQSEVIGNDTYSYAYDAGGNITSVSKNGVVQKTFTYGNSQWKDQMTKYGSENISYDSIGNMTRYGDVRYSWTRAHLLSWYQEYGHPSANYLYNIRGERFKKTVGGIDTDYIYSGDLLMRQITGSDIIDFSYDYYGKPIGFNYNGNKYFYIYDCLGNVVNVVDPTGTIQATYSYDAWGNILSSSGAVADINPIRYKGYYYDTESRLYYIKTRYYNPELRRFISPDTEFIAGENLFLGLNMYSYCYCNPLKYIDNDGKEPKIRTAMINLGCEAIRISSKLISKTIKSETDSFFNFANNEILPDIDRFFGQVFVKTEFMESTVKPMIEKSTESVMTGLVGFFPGLTGTFDRPTGLRHFMPVNMSGGAVWAEHFLGFKPQQYSGLNRKWNNYVSPDSGKFMWQSLVGYSTVYDFFFSLGGPIFRRYYEFQNTDNGHTTYYVVWIWKGDYWNLGAGAEIGIYLTNSSYSKDMHFYKVDTDLNLVVDMLIQYHDYLQPLVTLNHLTNKQGWWICSFTPDVQFPRVDWIDVYLNVKFYNSNLFIPFSAKYNTLGVNWNEITIPSTNSNYQFDVTY